MLKPYVFVTTRLVYAENEDGAWNALDIAFDEDVDNILDKTHWAIDDSIDEFPPIDLTP